MLKPRSYLIIALATLLAAASVGAAFLSLNPTPKPDDAHGKSSKPPVEDLRWESTFFAALEERTQSVHLPNLKTSGLKSNDIEARFWYDARPDIINGFIIRRDSAGWSALGIRQLQDRWPSAVRQEVLRVPRSGWEKLWQKLVDAGLLILPDSDEVKCSPQVLDGIGLVVEVAVNQGYRAYRYGNPQLANCDEAKHVLLIETIIADEFDLNVSPK